jgi:hypothetical protein
MKILLITILLSLCMIVGCSSPQVHPQTDWWQLTPTPDATSTNSVYIPSDLEDAFVELRRLMPSAMIDEMNGLSEGEVGAHYHRSFGMWIRNNWGLWAGSRLAQWFNRIGIYHPDDMSAIVIDSFWRHLHGRPIGLEEQVTFFRDYWLIHGPLPVPACPACGAELHMEALADDIDPSISDPYPGIKVFACTNSHVYFFHHSKGLYKPDESLIKTEWRELQNLKAFNKLFGDENPREPVQQSPDGDGLKPAP